jgi:hypothetical protein
LFADLKVRVGGQIRGADWEETRNPYCDIYCAHEKYSRSQKNAKTNAHGESIWIARSLLKLTKKTKSWRVKAFHSRNSILRPQTDKHGIIALAWEYQMERKMELDL